MKNRLFWKVIIVLPLLMFVDYLFMALLGCTTCLFGLEEDYYCGNYCLIGKIIILLSAIVFIRIIYPDLKGLFKPQENGKATEEKKSTYSANDERV
jgi:hypothetical protein